MSAQHRIALVTGGSAGIGFAIAERLITDGYSVIVTGRRRAELEAAARVLGSRCTAIVSDASNTEDITRLAAKVKSDLGRLDVLVCNAGGGDAAAFGKIDEPLIDISFDRNVKGVVLIAQALLPLIPAGGSIIFIGSTASTSARAGLSIYGATKAAIRALVKSWILDLQGSGIRMNIVSPGPIRTPALLAAAQDGDGEALLRALASESPSGRIGEPQEIASVVAFLAGDGASYIHGAEIFVDGGFAQSG